MSSKKRPSAKSKNAPIDPKLLKMFSTGIGKAELRRAAIIQVAIRIIDQEGLEKLSFEKIGNAVGIAKSHVVYYFSQKDEILARCAEYSTIVGQSYVVPAVAAAKAGGPRLQAYIEANFEWIKNHPDQARVFILLIANCSLNARMSAFYHEVRSTSLPRINAILEEMGFKDSPKKKAIALAILDLITGSIVALMTRTGKDFAKEWAISRESVIKACGEIASRPG